MKGLGIGKVSESVVRSVAVRSVWVGFGLNRVPCDLPQSSESKCHLFKDEKEKVGKKEGEIETCSFEAKTKEGSRRRGKPHILYFFTNCDGNWLEVFLIGGGWGWLY